MVPFVVVPNVVRDKYRLNTSATNYIYFNDANCKNTIFSLWS